MALIFRGTTGSYSTVPGLVILPIFGPHVIAANFSNGATGVAQFQAAVNEAIVVITRHCRVPMTCSMNFDWGWAGGTQVTVGGGLNNHTYVTPTYAQLRSAALANAKTVAATGAANSLPSSDLYTGGTLFVARTQAAALGLIAAPDASAFIGLNTANSYFWTQAQGAGVGFDAVGILMHEITECMGRERAAAGNPGLHFHYDYLSFTAAGAHNFDFAPANYFSVDNGTTSLNTFTNSGGNDPGDWNGTTIDSFNGAAVANTLGPLSVAGVAVMDALGFQCL